MNPVDYTAFMNDINSLSQQLRDEATENIETLLKTVEQLKQMQGKSNKELCKEYFENIIKGLESVPKQTKRILKQIEDMKTQIENLNKI